MEVFDEAYFQTVFYEHFDSVFNGFYKRTGSESVAQDLTQLTFIKFWEYRLSYSFDLPVRLQLNRKAKQVFIDWLRKEAHQRKLIAEINVQHATCTQPNKLELTNTLQTAIDKLPLMRKKVFTLAYIQGFSHKEIARMLNISTKTVDDHVLKALKKLRKILAFHTVLSIISCL